MSDDFRRSEALGLIPYEDAHILRAICGDCLDAAGVEHLGPSADHPSDVPVRCSQCGKRITLPPANYRLRCEQYAGIPRNAQGQQTEIDYCTCLNQSYIGKPGLCMDCKKPARDPEPGTLLIWRAWTHDPNEEPDAMNATLVIAATEDEAEDLVLRYYQEQWDRYCGEYGQDPDDEEEPRPKKLEDVCDGVQAFGPVDQPRVIDYMGE